MNPTTLKAIRADLETTICGITPSYAEHAAWRWSPLADYTKIPGSAPRTFSIVFANPSLELGETGLYGGGHSFTATLEIHVSYGRLPVDQDEEIIEEDGADLFFALEGRIGFVNGFLGIEHPSFVAHIDSDEGSISGRFDFPIRYFRRQE